MSAYEELLERCARKIFRTLFHPDESDDTIETKWLEWDRERKHSITAAKVTVDEVLRTLETQGPK